MREFTTHIDASTLRFVNSRKRKKTKLNNEIDNDTSFISPENVKSCKKGTLINFGESCSGMNFGERQGGRTTTSMERHPEHVVSKARKRKRSPDNYENNCTLPSATPMSRTARSDNTCFNASYSKLKYFKAGLCLRPMSGNCEFDEISSKKKKKNQLQTESSSFENLPSPSAYEMKPSYLKNSNLNNSPQCRRKKKKKKKDGVEDVTELEDLNSIVKRAINNFYETPDVMVCRAEKSSNYVALGADNMNQVTFDNSIPGLEYSKKKMKIQPPTDSSSFETLSSPFAYETKPYHFKNNLNDSRKVTRKKKKKKTKQAEVENITELGDINSDVSGISETFNGHGGRQYTFSEIIVNENESAINNSYKPVDEKVCSAETSSWCVVSDSNNMNRETFDNWAPKEVSSDKKKKIRSQTERSSFENLSSPCSYEEKHTHFQNSKLNNSQKARKKKKKKQTEVKDATELKDINSDGSVTTNFSALEGRKNTFSEGIVNENRSVLINFDETPDKMVCCAEASSGGSAHEPDNMNQETFGNWVPRVVSSDKIKKTQSQTGSNSFENLSSPCSYEVKHSHFRNNKLNNSQKARKKKKKKKQTEGEDAAELKDINSDGSVDLIFSDLEGRQNTFSEGIVNENRNALINFAETPDKVVCSAEASNGGSAHEFDNMNQETLDNWVFDNWVPRVVSSDKIKKTQSQAESSSFENLSSPCSYEVKHSHFQNNNNSQKVRKKKKKKQTEGEDAAELKDINSDGNVDSIFSDLDGRKNAFSEGTVNENRNALINFAETPDKILCSAEASNEGSAHEFDNMNQETLDDWVFDNWVPQAESSAFENLSFPCSYEVQNNKLNDSQKARKKKKKQTEVKDAAELKDINSDGSVDTIFSALERRQSTFSEGIVNENGSALINFAETPDKVVCSAEAGSEGSVHESDNMNQETFDNRQKVSKKKKKQNVEENDTELEGIINADGSVNSGTSYGSERRQNSFSEVENESKGVLVHSSETSNELVHSAKLSFRNGVHESGDNNEETFNQTLESKVYSFEKELLVEPMVMIRRNSTSHVETSYDESLIDVFEMSRKKNSKLSFKDMCVVLNHEVPALHKAHVRPCCVPNTEEKRVLLSLGMKQVPFSKSEDAILLANWDSFCEVHDVKDPSEFLDMRKIRNIEFKREFLQFIGNGLPHRALYQLYQRFQHLRRPKKGEFTEEEDRVILKVMNQNLPEPFKVLSQVLNRTRQAVYKRCKMLNAEVADKKESERERLKWDKPFAENVLKSLMKITKVSSPSKLKNRSITAEEWRKVEKDIHVPNWKLRQFWNYKLHVQLFAEKPISSAQISIKIIDWLCQCKPPNEKHIPWQESIHLFPGSTQWFMWEIFRRLKRSNKSNLNMPLADFIQLLYKNRQTMCNRQCHLPRYKVNEDLSLSVIEEDSDEQNHNSS